jgi:signal transduction histidine kinase
MIAMYSVAAFSKRWHRSMLGVLVAGFLGAGVVFAFTSDFRGVTEIISAFVMLAAAAFLGDTNRNRREYVAEVERRATLAVQAQEEEARRRIDEERIEIAREVHDVVAHSLSIVAVQASAAETLLEADPDKARESLANIRATSKDALGELRSMLEVLRTGAEAPTTPSADLTQLDQLVEPVREAGLSVVLDVRGDISIVPAFVSVSAYRIIQEALTNVVRHAKAKTVHVEVSAQPRTLTVTVADDGAGAPHDVAESAEGHGLRGMNERVEALGGTFFAGPDSAKTGFAVTATIPFPGGTS